jgi:DNA-binding transcriptional regulator YdaS (Cro superfamily)
MASSVDLIKTFVHNAGMNNFRRALDKRGLTPSLAAKSGLNYSTLLKVYKGARRVTAESAVLYERALGIPRWELRPDLWDPPHHPNPRTARDGE